MSLLWKRRNNKVLVKMIVIGIRRTTENVSVEISPYETEQVALKVICSVYDFPAHNVYIKDGKLMYDSHVLHNTGTLNSYTQFALPYTHRDAMHRDHEGIAVINAIKSYFTSNHDYR